MAKKKANMITPKQYAELTGTPYPTVMRWLQKELIPGAEKRELPFGGWYYAIPDDAPRPALKPGPKAKENGVVSMATEEKPTKPAKKAGSKKRSSK